MITYQPIKDSWIRVYYNNTLIGEFQKDVDGYFYFWPNRIKDGCSWSEHILLTLGEELRRLNKPWNEQIARDLTPCPS